MIYCICAGLVDVVVPNRIYIKRTSVPPNSLMKMSSENRKIFNFAVFFAFKSRYFFGLWFCYAVNVLITYGRPYH
ncbi:hypothetical protein FT236_20545 [Escherichia coli]|nr:hypothetical protein [Escherichia coli]